MIMTYKETHEIIIIGDLHVTLSTTRNYNIHDVLLQSFVHELGIDAEHSEKQTFFITKGHRHPRLVIFYLLMTKL